MAGIAVTVVLFLILSVIYSLALPVLFGAEVWARIAPGVERATTPAGVLVNLFIFALLIAALAISLWRVHRRSLPSVIGPVAPALWQFRRALVALVMLYTVIIVVPLPENMDLAPNLALSTWIRFLPLALLALFLQVLAEEVVFRGYLQSQLAARFASPIVWLALPSIVFGMLHFDPASHGATSWLVAGWATVFALAAGDLTARFGTLAPAVALHLVNNVSAILVAAPQGRFDGLALYAYPFSLKESEAVLALMPLDFLILLCSWLAIRLALRG